MKRNQRFLTISVLGAVILLFSASVYAYPLIPTQPQSFPAPSTMGLYLSNNGAYQLIYDNLAGDVNPAVGVVTYVGIVGGWTVNVSTALSYPVQGSTTSPYLDLNSINYSTAGAGELEILATSGYFNTPAVGYNFSIGGTLDPGATADFNSWWCLANWPFHQDNDALISNPDIFNVPGSFGGNYSGQLGFALSNYSITIQALLDDPTGGTTSFDAELKVPEPSILLLLGFSLIGLLGFRKRIKK